MIDYFLAIKILLGTGGGTLNCSGNPASSGTVDDAYQDAPEEAKAADGAAVSETASNAYADASTDGLICEESFMCKADIFADTLPDT
ncbi:MAG: hypothetical protein HYT75_02960, partial [Deltaproteobacteria bacterium]|nr:hypothetical protein [Deltaproteobacteria bacterium]